MRTRTAVLGVSVFIELVRAFVRASHWALGTAGGLAMNRAERQFDTHVAERPLKKMPRELISRGFSIGPKCIGPDAGVGGSRGVMRCSERCHRHRHGDDPFGRSVCTWTRLFRRLGADIVTSCGNDRVLADNLLAGDCIADTAANPV